LLLFECDVSYAAQKRPLILRIEETEALRNLLLQCRLNENLKTNQVFDVNQTGPLSYQQSEGMEASEDNERRAISHIAKHTYTLR